MKPSISARPAPLAASTALPAPPALMQNGFSHRTCLPASRAFSVHFTCIEFGRGT